MLEPGKIASVDAVVSEADTARALGSGAVAVLGTPAGAGARRGRDRFPG